MAAAVADVANAQDTTYAQAITDAFGDGRVIGKVTFGQPSAWSFSLCGSITKPTFSLSGMHVAWKHERAPARVKVRNVTPEQHPSQDLALVNPVDP